MLTKTLSKTLAWAFLNLLNKQRYDYLIKEFESLENAWRNIDAEILKMFACRKETISRTLKTIKNFDFDERQKYLEENDIILISIEDSAYPDTLRQIPDPPVFLFCKGNIDLLKSPSISIVGTRKMTSYGKRVVEEIVPELVRAGLTTISGLAIGIDAEVARETLRTGGTTVAVLGNGLPEIYPPSNSLLAEDIVNANGLLVTEFSPGTPPGKYTFPSRNRIIAGLSPGTIVIEAAEQSGSLITASLALEYGKDVFAIPGQIFDPNFAGTNQLISKSGAKLITSASDVLDELGINVTEEEKSSNYNPQTEDEAILYETLGKMPMTLDDLVEKTGLSAGKINTGLTLMELKGVVKNLGMGNWIKV
jgi:DNA processing protein